jgi:hypothetical protein
MGISTVRGHGVFFFRGQWVTSTAYLAVNLVLLGVDGPCSISKVLDASINDDLNG